MDEATREQLLDTRIQRRLASDRAYRNAENAEDQSAREWAIEREEEERLDGELLAARAAREEAEAKPGWVYMSAADIDEAALCGCELCARILAEGTTDHEDLRSQMLAEALIADGSDV